MLTRRTLKYLAPAALALAVVVACLAPAAFARISVNTIDKTATLSKSGRRIILSGPVQCDREQQVKMRVTVTQRSTGAVAEGYTVFTGTTEKQEWVLEAEAHGRNAFTEGPAVAVAIATTTLRGKTDDAHQWLVEITLEKE